MAMCKVQTVSLYRLATAFHSQADSLSSMRRIQRFLAKYALELDLIARVILLCFPKRGNSNTEERKQIMNRFIRLFGKSVVYMLVDVAVGEQRAGGLAEPPHKSRK